MAEREGEKKFDEFETGRRRSTGLCNFGFKHSFVRLVVTVTISRVQLCAEKQFRSEVFF